MANIGLYVHETDIANGQRIEGKRETKMCKVKGFNGTKTMQL
jgi:hypothetical protein